MQELIPAVERRFRVIGQPWARLLTGGSTGGWISLAQQVFHPDFYGGTWSLCPDAVDFRYHQIVNIYADSNAYWVNHGWMKVERPDVRRPDGNVETMMKDENWYERAVGDHSRSGGQWDIWEATYGPVGADGYPQRIWDKRTGVIDHQVADYWKQHFDLRNRLETNWATLGPKLADKINVYVGDADTYYLNDAVHLLDDFLRRTTSPRWTGEIVFQPGGAALLGAAAAGTVAEDGGAHGTDRAGRCRHQELAVLSRHVISGGASRSARQMGSPAHKSVGARLSLCPLPPRGGSSAVLLDP